MCRAKLFRLICKDDIIKFLADGLDHLAGHGTCHHHVIANSAGVVYVQGPIDYGSAIYVETHFVAGRGTHAGAFPRSQDNAHSGSLIGHENPSFFQTVRLFESQPVSIFFNVG